MAPVLVRILGLLGSVLVCEVGRSTFLRVQARWIAQLPLDWRTHPQLSERLEDALRPTRHFSWLGSGSVWYVLFVGVFALAAVAGATVGFELGWALVLAVIWGAMKIEQGRAKTRGLAASENLAVPRSRRMRAIYLGLFIVIWFGGLGACAFLGMLAALAVT